MSESMEVCVGCGNEADSLCESCEAPLCYGCDSRKYEDVLECKDEPACSKRITERNLCPHQ